MAKHKKDKDYQDELDVYQAAWVIGKQRGNKVPLKKEQYLVLLEAGRVGFDWLNEEEKKLVGQKSDGWKSGVSGEKTDENRLRVARIVVAGLMKDIHKEFSDVITEEEWVRYPKSLKKKTKWYLFRLMYGASPQLFAFDVYKRLGEKDAD